MLGGHFKIRNVSTRFVLKYLQVVQKKLKHISTTKDKILMNVVFVTIKSPFSVQYVKTISAFPVS